MSKEYNATSSTLTLKMIQDAMERATKNMTKALQYESIFGPYWELYPNPIRYKSKGFQKWTRHQVYYKDIKIGTIYE
jgi:hypothetical protein